LTGGPKGESKGLDKRAASEDSRSRNTSTGHRQPVRLPYGGQGLQVSGGTFQGPVMGTEGLATDASGISSPPYGRR